MPRKRTLFGFDCNTPFGSSQQLASAGAYAQTFCADQNEFPVSLCDTKIPYAY